MIKRYWKIIAALVVILAAGVGIGYSLGVREQKDRHRNMIKPESWAVMMMRRLDHELELTDEQKASLKPILEKTGEEIHQTRKQAMMTSWASIRSCYEEMEAHLSADQVEELKVSRQKLRERLQNPSNRPPGRPGSPMRPGGQKPGGQSGFPPGGKGNLKPSP